MGSIETEDKHVFTSIIFPNSRGPIFIKHRKKKLAFKHTFLFYNT